MKKTIKTLYAFTEDERKRVCELVDIMPTTWRSTSISEKDIEFPVKKIKYFEDRMIAVRSNPYLYKYDIDMFYDSIKLFSDHTIKKHQENMKMMDNDNPNVNQETGKDKREYLWLEGQIRRIEDNLQELHDILYEETDAEFRCREDMEDIEYEEFLEGKRVYRGSGGRKTLVKVKDLMSDMKKILNPKKKRKRIVKSLTGRVDTEYHTDQI